MRIVLAFVSTLVIALAMNKALAASEDEGRWCAINAQDFVRHCYFKRLRECQKAISDGNGLCVPNEKRRGEMAEDNSK